MVWQLDGLQCVFVLIGLSFMVVQDEDELGNYSGLSNPGRLGPNGANVCELADFKVSRDVFKVVPV